MECSRAPLSFALQVVAKVLYSCLCLLNAVDELPFMDENMFNDFSMDNQKGYYM